MVYVVTFIAIIIGILLLMKLSEMLVNTYWASQVCDDFITELMPCVSSKKAEKCDEILQKHKFPYFPGNVWWTKWINYPFKSKHVLFFIDFVKRRIFRFPVLMLAASSFLVIVSTRHFSSGYAVSVYFLTVIVLAGVWIKPLQLLIYRYRFGVADNFLYSLSVPIMSRTLEDSFSRLSALQKFLKLMFSAIICCLAGYSAIYHAIAQKFFVGQELAGDALTDAFPLWIYTSYFSVTIFLTVGFGDITPRGWFAVALVTSQMLLSMLLLIVFITAFSVTAPHED